MKMHKSVMLEEAIEALNIKEDGIYVDATLGYAGHSQEILKRIKRGFLFAFDQDQKAVEISQKKLNEIGQNNKVFHANFVNIPDILKQENVTSVDGILFDLGVSSPQIDDGTRGFSFMQDGPLDMKMNEDNDFSAQNVVNEYSYADLKNVFYSFGEEKKSAYIASAIVEYRAKRKITTTKELVQIIVNSVGPKYFNEHHPERNIFQAIRIEVNAELQVLETVLPNVIDLLNLGGRIVVITFHSLEDRIVKRIFKKYSEVNEVFKGLPDIPKEYQPKIKLINKKPLLPSKEEMKENPRSKSAKLRIVERTLKND